MTGRYLVRSKWKARGFGLIDAILALRKRLERLPVAPPKRLIIANWAHMGDVLLVFSAVAALREQLSDLHIGMIAGSWSKPLFDGNTLIDQVHFVDHWYLNRAPIPLREKVRRYRTMRREAVSGIAQAGYDAGLDFYPFFPPAFPLLRAAGVPWIAGYESGGFGPLADRALAWDTAPRHTSDHHRDLLNLLPGVRVEAGALRAVFGSAIPPGPVEKPYILLHPGTGAAYKEWPEANWNILAKELAACGRPIYISGSGTREKALAQRLAAEHPHLTNMVDTVPWKGYAALVANADLLICTDSVAGHVAATFGVPTISIFSGIVPPAEWAPLNPRGIALEPNLSSTPSQAVNPEEVLRKAYYLLGTRRL